MPLATRCAAVAATVVLIWIGWVSGPASAPAEPITVTVDGGAERQTFVGFGGEIQLHAFIGWDPADRRRLLEFLFGRGPGQLGLNFPRWVNNGYPEEGGRRIGAAGIWGANDNSDAGVIDWDTFQWAGARGPMPEATVGQAEAAVMSQARSLGVTGGYFGTIQGPKWNGFWTDADGPPPPDSRSSFDPDEMVENKLALLLHFRRFGVTFDMISPFSEPGGGGINWRLTRSQVVDVVRRLGARLEAEGFARPRFSVPGNVDVRSATEYAKAILADPGAAKYVGAIEYHAYRESGGNGAEDPERDTPRSVEARRELSGFARSNRLPVRMTEYGADSKLIARANGIVTELSFADSQTYMPLFLLIDRERSGGHGSEKQGPAVAVYDLDEDGRLKSVGPTRDTGVAVGAFSRHIRPGAVRLETSSSARTLRAVAFRDDVRRRLVAVIVNNSEASREVTVELRGLRVLAPVVGDQTVEAASEYWVPLREASLRASDLVTVTVRGRSVTAMSAPLDGGPTPDASPGSRPASSVPPAEAPIDDGRGRPTERPGEATADPVAAGRAPGDDRPGVSRAILGAGAALVLLAGGGALLAARRRRT